MTVTQRKVPDKLIVPESITNTFNITDCIGACIVGNMNDARFVVQWLRNEAAQFKLKNQYEPTVQIMAQKLALQLQRFSQYAQMRPFCVQVTLAGCDEEHGPQIYKVDPAGQSLGYRAIATGAKDQEAVTQLEKAWKKN